MGLRDTVTPDKSARRSRKRASAPTLDLTPLSEIRAEELNWLWPHRIPAGKLTLLAGHPGVSKSILTADIAAHVSIGAPFPDAPDAPAEPGDVLVLSAEDAPTDTLVPRVRAASANMERIHIPDHSGPIDLGRDLHRLRGSLQDLRAPRLVVIDPLSAYLGSADTHRDVAVRRVLAPLAQLGAELDVAIVVVAHLSKRSAAALKRVGGSGGFVAAARMAHVVGRDPDEPSARVIAPLKTNLAAAPPPLRYHLETTVTEQSGEQPRIVWGEQHPDLSADDVILASEQPHRHSEPERAAEWLRAPRRWPGLAAARAA